MNGKTLLAKIADEALRKHSLATDFSAAALEQLERIHKPGDIARDGVVDCQKMLWCSIDNDDSRDLDQLTYAKADGDDVTIYVAVADVDVLVPRETPLDIQAQVNTTSIYTAAKMYPMLPEKLSTDLTSLNEAVARRAMIFEMLVSKEGTVQSYKIYPGAVYNYAKLTYNTVGAWLEGRAAEPQKITALPGLAESIKLQDCIAQAIKHKRHEHGALTLQTIELKAAFDSAGNLKALEPMEHNRAHELIENLMIAANTSSATYMSEHKLPSLRRIVRKPERWDRIVDLAAEHNAHLPADPDSAALDRFLIKMQKEEPDLFPDLSLSVVKLLGSGEYIVEMPADNPIGHFGLALRMYSHSTAPNRRYPDIITQRILKSSLQNRHTPYALRQLENIADLCTDQEDLAAKVERQVLKSAASMLLSERIGETFDAIVTGASYKGTWVRLDNLYVEGKLVVGGQGVDVGDRIQVKLLAVDIPLGHLDFARMSQPNR